MTEPTIIGKIPAGSTVIRQATIEDRETDPTRMVLYADKDGTEHWICYRIEPTTLTATIPVTLVD